MNLEPSSVAVGVLIGAVGIMLLLLIAAQMYADAMANGHRPRCRALGLAFASRSSAHLALMKPSEFEEVADYPGLKDFLDRHFDMQVNDVEVQEAGGRLLPVRTTRIFRD